MSLPPHPARPGLLRNRGRQSFRTRKSIVSLVADSTSIFTSLYRMILASASYVRFWLSAGRAVLSGVYSR